MEYFFGKDETLVKLLFKGLIYYNFHIVLSFLSIFRLYQKNTPQICLILHQFKFFVLLICGKKLVTIKHFLCSHLKLKNGSFSTIFKI